jgi:ribosomal protein S18 acetylase RimI-like enzyme
MPNVLGKTATITRLHGREGERTFHQIEALHRAQLAAGALAHMPATFLAGFYRYLATRTDCVVLTAEKDGAVAGFVAGTLHASGLLKAFVLAQPLQMVGYGAKLLLTPTLLFRVVSLASQLVSRGPEPDIDERQLLSIAVDPGDIRAGIGRTLFHGVQDWFRSQGADDFGIIAARTQIAALEFYRRCGAVEVGETSLGGLSSIRFRRAVPPA